MSNKNNFNHRKPSTDLFKLQQVSEINSKKIGSLKLNLSFINEKDSKRIGEGIFSSSSFFLRWNNLVLGKRYFKEIISLIFSNDNNNKLCYTGLSSKEISMLNREGNDLSNYLKRTNRDGNFKMIKFSTRNKNGKGERVLGFSYFNDLGEYRNLIIAPVKILTKKS